MPSHPDSGRPAPVAPGVGASLEQWLAYLESIHPIGIDLGLDRVLLVLRRLFPHKPAGRIITVAGTNGKGSTVAALEALLQAAGRRTGAYTSPHLHRYNERIRIDGNDIDDATLIRAFERVEQARGAVSLTYFEFGTLAAFVTFAEAGVDDWILEVGLGGRLDAVNVLDADLAVIASVDIDHADFLGHDRETIGFEKAGILRPGIPAIYADDAPPRSVLQQAAAQRVALALLGRDYEIRHEGGAVYLQYQSLRLSLPAGPLPVKSLAAAAVAVHRLEPELPPSTLESVLARVRVAGRFERLGEAPPVYVDVGHNPHAAGWLAGRVRDLPGPPRKVIAVYAALADEDVEGVALRMAPVVSEWHLAPLAVPRGLALADLSARLAAAGVTGRGHDSVADALAAAKAAAGEDGVVVVFGSFFTVAEARAVLVSGVP